MELQLLLHIAEEAKVSLTVLCRNPGTWAQQHPRTRTHTHTNTNTHTQIMARYLWNDSVSRGCCWCRSRSQPDGQWVQTPLVFKFILGKIDFWEFLTVWVVLDCEPHMDVLATLTYTPTYTPCVCSRLTGTDWCCLDSFLLNVNAHPHQ